MLGCPPLYTSHITLYPLGSPTRYSHGDFLRGTVLVFLPGLPEIRMMQDVLNGHYSNLKLVHIYTCAVIIPAHSLTHSLSLSLSLFPLPLHRLNLMLLHSSISSDEQSKVFLKPELGRRKVILATNIAESSITVPDIKYGQPSSSCKNCILL